MKENSRIFVAGHRGLVGGAITRELLQCGYGDLLLKTRSELDLRDAHAVNDFFESSQPDYVFLAAAKVGGILANDTYPADFIRDNLQIQTNVIDSAYRSGVKRLLFLGSTCVYPKNCPQPIREDYLLTGPLEPTNRAYALAKIAGIEMCWSYNRQYGTKFIAAMPTNLYGPGDNFDLQNSHVLPALIRKAMEAKFEGAQSITVWGTGTPRRELLNSGDLAEACVYLMSLQEPKFDAMFRNSERPLINIGTGEDHTIREIAELVCRTVGFQGDLVFDTSKPDGTPRKVCDVSKINALGWRARTTLHQGLVEVVAQYRAALATAS
jgi:GDP-L-fucose synthase